MSTNYLYIFPTKKIQKIQLYNIVPTTQKTKQNFEHLSPKPHTYTLKKHETPKNPPNAIAKGEVRNFV